MKCKFTYFSGVIIENFDQRKNKGILLVAISAAAYGFMPIFVKMAYAAGTGTYTLLFLRFLSAAVFMFSLMFFRKLTMPSRREIISFLLLGAVVYVGQSFCYFTALNYASASVVALLLYTYPALVMLGSAIFLKEKITKPMLLSLILALAGAFVIVGGEYNAEPLGLILSIMAALFYTFYVIISSKVVKPGMGVQSSAFIMLGAAVVYGIMNLFTGFSPPQQPAGYLAILLLSLISTVIAFWAFLTGVVKTGPSTGALVSILEPVVTVFSSVVFLSEKLTPGIIVGGILVLSALFITTLHKNAD